MTVLRNQAGQNLQVLSDRVCIKLKSAVSANSMAVMTVEVPPDGFVPPHTHAKEEESYFMLQGTMVMQLGNQELTIEPGDFVHVPAGTVHGYKNDADLLKVHFAETWNELHHLLIMESLGGNRRWLDRAIAQHVGVAYYWIVVLLYMLTPQHAYYLMELIEAHAYHTYDDYLKAHEVELKAQSAPQIAINYYRDGDIYMFEETQFPSGQEFRRPQVDTLYDVFVNIRDDEGEHIKTMSALQQFEVRRNFHSPHTVIELATANPEQ